MYKIVFVNGKQVKVVSKALQKILQTMDKYGIHYINIINEGKEKKSVYVGNNKQILFAYEPKKGA